jgi:hypothetical protein
MNGFKGHAVSTGSDRRATRNDRPQTPPRALPGRQMTAGVIDVERWRIGNGHYVTVTIPGSEPEKITDTFSTADEAWRWIKNESAAWFHARKERLAVN